MPPPIVEASFLSSVRYDAPEVAAHLSTNTLKAITDTFKFTHLSKVQHATLGPLMGGADVFAKAKTGSGKTLAFLIPIVEMIAAARRSAGGARSGGISALVIAPTRELALQILKEAHTLLTHHAGMSAQAVIGGRPIGGERGRMGFSGGGGSGGGRCTTDILIATPGRLVDHIESTPGFPAALMSVRFLVMDEADRLLDMGFKPAIDKILSYLPRNAAPGGAGAAVGGAGTSSSSAAAGGAAARYGGGSGGGRQNLLFSATVPREVLAIATRVLRPKYDFVDLVGEEEPTHAHVDQEFLVVPLASVVPALARIVAHTMTADPTCKAILFFPTARMAGYMASLFGADASGVGMGYNVVEIHSRISQSARNSAAERFKKEKGIILFASDAVARGLDFPEVTRVIQVGLTDKEQYVHRLGRTARAGRSGAGLLLLADFEAPLLNELSHLPLKPATATSALTGGAANGLPGHPATAGPAAATGGAGASSSGGRPPRVIVPASSVASSPPALVRTLTRVASNSAMAREAAQCYSAWLGFYKGSLRMVGWTKEKLVEQANMLFMTLGCTEIPMMPRDTLGKMGLRGTVGIREGPPGWKPS